MQHSGRTSGERVVRQVKSATSEFFSTEWAAKVGHETASFQRKGGIRPEKVQGVKKWEAGHTRQMNFDDMKTAPDTWFLGLRQLPTQKLSSSQWFLAEAGRAQAKPDPDCGSDLQRLLLAAPDMPAAQHTPVPHWQHTSQGFSAFRYPLHCLFSRDENIVPWPSSYKLLFSESI